MPAASLGVHEHDEKHIDASKGSESQRFKRMYAKTRDEMINFLGLQSQKQGLDSNESAIRRSRTMSANEDQTISTLFSDDHIKLFEAEAREHVYRFLKLGMSAGSIAINNTCNLQCSHCYILTSENNGIQASDGYRAIPTDFFNQDTAVGIAQDFRKSGALLLTIPAMEPLLTGGSRSASLAVAKEFVPDEDINNNRARSLALITNATLADKLSDEEVVEIAKRFEVLSVSIEAGHEMHDRIRGLESYDKAVNGIHSLVSRGYNPTQIALQSTVQRSLNNPYEQARQVLELGQQLGTGRASFTAEINPRLTFSPTSDDVDYHYWVFSEILNACKDAETEGIGNIRLHIYTTYESPAALLALRRIMAEASQSEGDIQFNAFHNSLIYKVRGYGTLDVKLEVSPFPIEVPGYPRIAAAKDNKKNINITDVQVQPYQGAEMTNCFGYQTHEPVWAHWMPGIIQYFDIGMQRRANQLAETVELLSQDQIISVDPNIPRTKQEYFEEILTAGVQLQLRRTAFLLATYDMLK